MSERFHPKYHRFNHHSEFSNTNSDAGLDPIGADGFPFMGDFVLVGPLSSHNSNKTSVFYSTNTAFKCETLSEDQNLALRSEGNLMLSGNCLVTGDIYGPNIYPNSSNTYYLFSPTFSERLSLDSITQYLSSEVSLRLDNETLRLGEMGQIVLDPSLQENLAKVNFFSPGFIVRQGAEIISEIDGTVSYEMDVSLNTSSILGLYIDENNKLKASTFFSSYVGLYANSISHLLSTDINSSDFYLLDNKLKLRTNFGSYGLNLNPSSGLISIKNGTHLTVKDDKLKLTYTFSKGTSSNPAGNVVLNFNPDNFYISNNKLGLKDVVFTSKSSNQQNINGQVYIPQKINVKSLSINGSIDMVSSPISEYPKILGEPSHEMGGIVLGTEDNRIIGLGSLNSFLFNAPDFLSSLRKSSNITPTMASFLSDYIGKNQTTDTHPYINSLDFERLVPVPAIIPFKDSYNLKTNTSIKQIKYTAWGVTVLMTNGTVWTCGLGANSSLEKQTSTDISTKTTPQYIFEQVRFPGQAFIEKIDVTSAISITQPQNCSFYKEDLNKHSYLFCQKFVALGSNKQVYFWGRNFSNKFNPPVALPDVLTSIGSINPAAHYEIGNSPILTDVTDVKLCTSINFVKALTFSSSLLSGVPSQLPGNKKGFIKDFFLYPRIGELVLIIKNGILYSYGNLVGDFNFIENTNNETKLFSGPNYMPLVTMGRPFSNNVPHSDLALYTANAKPNQTYNKNSTGISTSKIAPCVEIKNNLPAFSSNLTIDSFSTVSNVKKFVESGNNNTDLIGVIKNDGSVFVASNMFHGSAGSDITSSNNINFSYFIKIANLPPVEDAVISPVYNSYKLFDFVVSETSQTASLSFYASGATVSSPYCAPQTYLMAAKSTSEEAWLWFLGRDIKSKKYFQTQPVKLNIPAIKKIAHTRLDICSSRPYENVAFLTKNNLIYVPKFRTPQEDADGYLNPESFNFDVTLAENVSKDLEDKAKFVPLPIDGVKNISFINHSWIHEDVFSVLDGGVLQDGNPITINEGTSYTNKTVYKVVLFPNMHNNPPIKTEMTIAQFDDPSAAKSLLNDKVYFYNWFINNGYGNLDFIKKYTAEYTRLGRHDSKVFYNMFEGPAFGPAITATPAGYWTARIDASSDLIPMTGATGWVIVAYAGATITSLSEGVRDSIIKSATNDTLSLGGINWALTTPFASREAAETWFKDNKKVIAAGNIRYNNRCPKYTFIEVPLNSKIYPPKFVTDVRVFHTPKEDREYTYGLLIEKFSGEIFFYSYLTHKLINYSKFFT